MFSQASPFFQPQKISELNKNMLPNLFITITLETPNFCPLLTGDRFSEVVFML
jgi:hypothetical protein